MNKQITIPFQLTGWDAVPYDETTEDLTLSRITVKKTFDGELKGESMGELLMCSSTDGSAGYTIMDRVSGELCGHQGSFVMIHGGTTDAMRCEPAEKSCRVREPKNCAASAARLNLNQMKTAKV